MGEEQPRNLNTCSLGHFLWKGGMRPRVDQVGWKVSLSRNISQGAYDWALYENWHHCP